MDPAALGFALVAGAVAAVNPCGFALLPAYLGLLVGGDRARAVPGAVRFAGGMTVGFVAVFGLVGVVLAPLLGSLTRYLPVVAAAMGIVLVGLGAWILTGRSVAVPGLAGRGTAPTTRWWSHVGYGVSFALASLSCTIAPFLAAVAGALRAGGPLGVAAAFVAYALGMGVVVLALALAVALASTRTVAAMRRAGAVAGRVSGLLLVVAGAYVAWYGWVELRSLAGGPSGDPVIAAATELQAVLTGSVAGLGVGGLLAVAAGLAVVLAVAVRRGRRARL